MAHILFLVQVDDVEREWIAPSLMVPVSDVLAEHDGLHAGDWLLRVKLFEDSIGRRTVRASFGSEELDENGIASRGCCGGILLGARARSEGSQCERGCSETCEARRRSLKLPDHHAN